MMQKPFGAVLAFGLVVLCAMPPKASASDPCGIFARIHSVTLGPDDVTKANWIRIYGDFLVIKTSGRMTEVPVRGYLWFKLPKDDTPLQNKRKNCRIEWADLKAIAGTKNSFVAFGSVHSLVRTDFAKNGNITPNVTPTARKPPDPKRVLPYPLNHGLVLLRHNEQFRGGRGATPYNKLKEFLEKNPLPE